MGSGVTRPAALVAGSYRVRGTRGAGEEAAGAVEAPLLPDGGWSDGPTVATDCRTGSPFAPETEISHSSHQTRARGLSRGASGAIVLKR